MRLEITSALTPALSPRRGSAATASSGIESLAASAHATSAAELVMNSAAPFALPLLGERAGVRANQFK